MHSPSVVITRIHLAVWMTRVVPKMERTFKEVFVKVLKPGWHPRVFFIVCCLELAAYAMQAQVLIGPVAGPQLSWVNFFDKDSKGFYNQRPKLGYHAGVDISFQVRQKFYMHTNVLYSVKGKSLSSDQSADFKQKERDRYIEMPVLFTREFTSHVGGNANKVFKWYLAMGPNISYWLGGKGKLTATQLLENDIPYMNYKLRFGEGEPQEGYVQVHEANRVQLGLNISVGCAFEPLGFQKIYANLRYEWGHTYLARNGEGIFPGVNDYSDDLKARTQGFRLSFSYLFDLKTSERKKGKSTINKKKLR